MTFDSFLKEACPLLDLSWRKYRRYPARHRLDARMKELGIPDYAGYLDAIRGDPAEAALLPDLIRVTVTRFFREQRGWRELTEQVLPELIFSRPVPAAVLHAWSAGCCGGEEPYSLALCWLEYLQPRHPGSSMTILATDIDTPSLERAVRGVYQLQSLREVPPEVRERWFTRSGSDYEVRAEARELVSFRYHNLQTDPPPGEMDLILCRYLPFTYYQGGRLVATARRLWEALRPEGVLMIGAKERLPPAAQEWFAPIGENGFFYRREG